MKRQICCLTWLMLCLVCRLVCAQIMCDCGQKECVCFIQMGDEGIAVKGIIKRLADQGYLKSGKGSTYNERVVDAVCAFQKDNGVQATGMMDDDTLTLLIWGMDAEALDRAKPKSNPGTVYVPTDGGKKRHKKPTCSGMYDPRKMSVRNAEALDIEVCKRCKPD